MKSDTRALEAGPKLCRDCKWMREPGAYAKCVAPQNLKPLLTGFEAEAELRKYVFCSTHRSTISTGPDDCGSEGLLFEAASE